MQIVRATERLKIVGPSLMLLCAGLAGVMAPRLLPVDGARVAVVAPGADALVIVAAAGGQALAATPTGVIAASNEPGFAQRLYRSGAWLVMRYEGGTGCLTTETKESQNERG